LGVRTDAGYESGDTVSRFYDNLVAKLIVWGEDREGARRRMLRALGEMVVDGVATTIPAQRAILEHPDFAAAAHSTRWVEERLDLSGLASQDLAPADEHRDGGRVLREVDAEVDGRRYRVKLWVPDLAGAPARGASGGSAGRAGPGAAGGGRGRAAAALAVGGSGKVAVPMQGTIVQVLVAVGDIVETGQTICILEAMKMENPITADKDGTVTELRVKPGDSLGAGDVVAVIE
jgi:acetyl-CoA/propionyl-CoA carboxylase biotin carboxyl carrier protein